MLVTNHEGLAELTRSMRAHGWVRNMDSAKKYSQQYPELDPRFLFISTGFNVRPTEINGILGISQLQKLDKFNQKRNFIKSKWDADLKTLYDCNKLKIVKITDRTEAAPFGYPVLCENKIIRNAFQNYLEKHGIETRPIVCGNITRQPAMKYYAHRVYDELSGADKVMDCGIYWGLHPMMTDQQIDYVSSTILEFFK